MWLIISYDEFIELLWIQIELWDFVSFDMFILIMNFYISSNVSNWEQRRKVLILEILISNFLHMKTKDRITAPHVHFHLSGRSLADSSLTNQHSHNEQKKIIIRFYLPQRRRSLSALLKGSDAPSSLQCSHQCRCIKRKIPCRWRRRNNKEQAITIRVYHELLLTKFRYLPEGSSDPVNELRVLILKDEAGRKDKVFLYDSQGDEQTFRNGRYSPPPKRVCPQRYLLNCRRIEI